MFLSMIEQPFLSTLFSSHLNWWHILDEVDGELLVDLLRPVHESGAAEVVLGPRLAGVDGEVVAAALETTTDVFASYIKGWVHQCQ